MEGGDQNNLGNGGSRWNPTKEQISLLESLYKQGLRTPTAEQIQQITNRLRAFGHIEGKNVFYWFQNHKARQRQKQKQENLAYFNRFIHATTPPVFPSYPRNVLCSPRYLPQSKNDHPTGFYQQYSKVPLPAAGGHHFKRTKLIPENNIHDHQIYNRSMHDQPRITKDQETLDLFPIHPTGLSQARTRETENQNKNFIFYEGAGSNGGPHHHDDHEHGQPFFDFFCGNNNN